MSIVFDVSAAWGEGHVTVLGKSSVQITTLQLGGLHFWRTMLRWQPALARSTESSSLCRRSRRWWLEPFEIRADSKACLELLALRFLDLVTHICKWKV